MAAGYNIPATDALGMLGDAHSTNWAENCQFFLNQNNPTNFERIWQTSPTSSTGGSARSATSRCRSTR